MGVRVTRTAQASWRGDLTGGGGRIGVGSGAYEGPRIDLRSEGEVPGVDAEAFERLAQEAEDTCPVSRALAGTEITLEVRLAGN
jgi:organic hydroperoxide reductase OsmC/OhrA